MACSVSDKYGGWCKDYPTSSLAYNIEGKTLSYCIFHALADGINKSVNGFNENVFNEIHACIHKGKSCNLSGSIFPGDIDFGRIEAAFPEISFSDAIFHGKVTFHEKIFDQNVTFRNAEFKDKVRFIDIKFNGKESSFNGTRFYKKIEFISVDFNGESFFSDVTFEEEAYFLKVNFLSNVYFHELNIGKKIKFDLVNLEKASFLDTDLRKLDMINCVWQRKNGRFVLFDEILSLNKKAGSKKNLKKVESMYRMLKQKYKEEHNEFEVSNWHYGEKEMARKYNPWSRFNPLSLYNLYWLSSGYGERPLRASIFLIVLIILLTVVFGFVESISFYKYSLLLFNTLQNATFDKTPEFSAKSLNGKYLTLAMKIFIPIQAALLALAVRNKFRR
ncbi:MAG TPA: pentapeptide repeat-containing protein [Nitrospirota bacterium]|nr:pentapeptide repeat-containing protein [Nitrospirota bacterium]